MDSTGSSADAGQAHAADGEEDDIWQGALEAAGVEECGGSGGPPASGELEGDIGGDIGREAAGDLEGGDIGGDISGDIGGDIGGEAASEVAGDIGGDIGREAASGVTAESLAGCSGGLGLARSPVAPPEASASEDDWGEWGGADLERAEDVESSAQDQADVPPQSQEADVSPHSQEEDVPPQSQEADVSPHSQEADVSLHSQEEDVPPQSQEAEVPPESQEADVPPESQEADAPPQSKEADVPPQCQEEAVPLQSEEADAPEQAETTETEIAAQPEAIETTETVVEAAEAETPMQADEPEAPVHEEEALDEAPAADEWDAWDDDDDWETGAAPSVKTGRQILDTWCKDAAQSNLCPLLMHLKDSPASIADLDSTLQGCIPADMHRLLTVGDVSSQTTASTLTGVSCAFTDAEDCIDGALSSASFSSEGAVKAAFFATLGKFMQFPPGQDPSRLLSSMAAARDDAPDRVKAYLANLPDLSHLYSTSIVTN